MVSVIPGGIFVACAEGVEGLYGPGNWLPARRSSSRPSGDGNCSMNSIRNCSNISSSMK